MAVLIVGAIKELEVETKQDSIQQKIIVDRVVQKLELEQQDRETDISRTVETSKKIASVISHLITKESVLMVTQDAKVKHDRYICLSVSLDL